MKQILWLVVTAFVVLSCSGASTIRFDDSDFDKDLPPDEEHVVDKDSDVTDEGVADRDTVLDENNRLDEDFTSDSDIVIVDDPTWIASGADGMVALSENGEKWVYFSLSEQETINSVSCNENGDCLLVGNDGGIYRGVGGTVWSKESFSSSYPLYSLFFNQTEWLVGGRKETLFSDKGESWKRLYLSVADGGIAISTVWQIFKCNNIWFIRGDSAVYSSVDTITWHQWTVDGNNPKITPKGDMLCLADDTFIVGLNLYSTDGKSWYERKESDISPFADGFENESMVQGKDGRILLSGFNWNDDNSLGEIAIRYSDDGAKTWKKSSLPEEFIKSRHIVGSLATDNNGRWVCVTQQGDFLLSKDNGASWEVVEQKAGWNIFTVGHRG